MLVYATKWRGEEMGITTIIVFLLAAALGYLTFRLWDSDNPALYFVGLFVFILVMAGIGSCREDFRNRIENVAAQHAGHEAMHAQIEKDLGGAEPGDILERPGEYRMFVTNRQTRSSINAHPIFSYDRWTLSHSDLVLAHAKIIKLGTPEHAAALEAEAADKFSYYHRKPR